MEENQNLLEKISYQLNNKIKKLKKLVEIELGKEASNIVYNKLKKHIKEINSYPYLKRLTYLTELNESIQVS